MAQKLYGLINADPPWHFRNWSADAPGKIHDRARGAAKHYPTATTADICKLIPPSLPNAILLIWVASPSIPDALQVIEAWGFTQKSIAWWWTKVDRFGRPRIMGGYWFRQTGELCLLATKGRPPRPEWKGEPGSIISFKQPKHSQKPDEQYEKIDRVFPEAVYGPRLEMFARSRRPGWDVFGNEVEGSIDLWETKP